MPIGQLNLFDYEIEALNKELKELEEWWQKQKNQKKKS